MMNWLYKDDLKDIHTALIPLKSYLEFSFDLQLKIFAQVRHLPNLEKLSNFTFKRHKEFNLSKEWLKPIEQYIRARAHRAIQFIEEKQKPVMLVDKVSEVKEEISIKIIKNPNNAQQESTTHKDIRKRK